jgi:hypothetical protein
METKVHHLSQWQRKRNESLPPRNCRVCNKEFYSKTGQQFCFEHQWMKTPMLNKALLAEYKKEFV